VTAGGVEFVAADGRRIGWSELAKRGRATGNVRAVHEAAAPDVRRVSLWLRGSGRVRIGPARFRAVVPALDPLLVGCGLGRPFALPLGSLATRFGRHGSTGGVRTASWLGHDRLLMTFGRESGWQGLSVGIRTSQLVTEDADLTATASLELLRVAGAQRFALEQYADGERRRVGWHELAGPPTGQRLAQPLEGTADRLGFWILRNDEPAALLELRIRLGWQLRLYGIALDGRETSCVLRGLPPGGSVTVSHGRLGLFVDDTTLASAGFTRGDAALAGSLLSALAAAGVLLLVRWRLRSRAEHAGAPAPARDGPGAAG
jgi:hypothetical protein